MADNYLERQRETYEARKAAWLKNKKKPTKKKVSAAGKSTPTSAGETK
jgi:hypothetical protein